jgi:hypothetical protein
MKKKICHLKTLIIIIIKIKIITITIIINKIKKIRKMKTNKLKMKINYLEVRNIK